MRISIRVSIVPFFNPSENHNIIYSFISDQNGVWRSFGRLSPGEVACARGRRRRSEDVRFQSAARQKGHFFYGNAFFGCPKLSGHRSIFSVLFSANWLPTTEQSFGTVLVRVVCWSWTQFGSEFILIWSLSIPSVVWHWTHSQWLFSCHLPSSTQISWPEGIQKKFFLLVNRYLMSSQFVLWS